MSAKNDPFRPGQKQSDPQQLALDLQHRTSLSGDDFLVADSNRLAVDWLDRWPDWPSNVLILVGPQSAGKTHLASVHAATSGGLLIQDFPSDGDALACLIGQADQALILDDVDAVTGAAAEQVLFHLINMVRAEQKTLLLTAKTVPATWGVSLPDLSSRLKAAAVVEIAPPDDQLLQAVLIKLFHDRQLRIDADLLGYLVQRMERSFQAATDLVARLDQASLAGQRPITKPLARAILAGDH